MSASIGQRLKQEREARFLTLEKASEVTRIRVVFLRALEADDYSAMPSAAQGRGFLRNYAEYLELNVDEIIAEIQKNAPLPAEVSGPLAQVNLDETDLPLMEAQAEKPARLVAAFQRFDALRSTLTLWLDRRAPAETEIEFIAPTPEQVGADAEEATDIKPAEETVQREAAMEIKPAEASLLVEAQQPEVKDEASPSFVSRLASLFRFRAAKAESESMLELENDDALAIDSIAPSLPADVIFVEIGAQLRARRELISLTMDEVERHTRLRAAFIKNLEAGAFDKLSSPVQTRGMLANYATFLDLDTDAVLLRFADGLQARRHEKYAKTPREKIQTEVITSLPFLRSFIAGDLIFGVAMMVVLVGLAIWGVGRVISQDVQAKPTAPPIVFGGATLPTPSLETTFAPVNPLATAGADALTSLNSQPTLSGVANVTVSVFAIERVFARISVDGKVAFEGRLAPRDAKVFEAENQVEVLTGNAAALQITHNGRNLGLMGNVGEVISRVYLISGIATPTATVSPTPTNTAPATITPTPTLTPTFTPPSN